MTPTKQAIHAAGSLIRAVEIWLPSEDGSLSIDQSFYDRSPCLESVSDGLTFEPGQGLPGQVFESAKPIVFRDFGDSEFARTEAAGDDGLVAGVGIPVLRKGACVAVVVMLFGSDENAIGGLECWVPVKERYELTLETSFYAGIPRFEKISQYVQFPKGSGLPGTVWEEKAPSLLIGLATSKSFMRAAGAGAEGLSSAIAWPITDYGDQLHATCVLLSAKRSPLAAVLQVWQPTESSPLALTRTDASEGHPLREACRANPPAPGDGMFGAIFENDLPRVVTNLSERDDPISIAAVKSGLSRFVAIPVYAGEELRGVIALWN